MYELSALSFYNLYTFVELCFVQEYDAILRASGLFLIFKILLNNIASELYFFRAFSHLNWYATWAIFLMTSTFSWASPTSFALILQEKFGAFLSYEYLPLSLTGLLVLRSLENYSLLIWGTNLFILR